jgi:hypothetical protein
MQNTLRPRRSCDSNRDAAPSRFLYHLWLERVGQFDFRPQCFDAPVGFRPGQPLLEKPGLVGLFTEGSQPQGLRVGHLGGYPVLDTTVTG